VAPGTHPRDSAPLGLHPPRSSAVGCRRRVPRHRRFRNRLGAAARRHLRRPPARRRRMPGGRLLDRGTRARPRRRAAGAPPAVVLGLRGTAARPPVSHAVRRVLASSGSPPGGRHARGPHAAPRRASPTSSCSRKCATLPVTAGRNCRRDLRGASCGGRSVSGGSPGRWSRSISWLRTPGRPRRRRANAWARSELGRHASTLGVCLCRRSRSCLQPPRGGCVAARSRAGPSAFSRECSRQRVGVRRIAGRARSFRGRCRD
jgi:hypothetical protein